MNLMVPLASITPGLDSAALTVLAGADTAMSATQIQRVAARGSRYGLVLVLERLAEHGLVTAIPAGRGSLYRFNREHVLASAVIAAVQSRAELNRRLADGLRAMTPAPLGAAIYGSVARGDATPASDIDLLVIIRNDVDTDSDLWIRQADELARQVRSWSGNALQLATVSPNQLAGMARAHDHIVDEWERDAHTIMGKDVRGYIRAARKGPPEP